MPEPTVSVFIPCYNERRTITGVLDALRKQTYPLDQMEVVIADGMSDDGTREVLHEYQRVHPEMKLVLVDNPQRIIPAALNRAIAAAQGEILVRMDAHSKPPESYVATCVAVLEETGAANVGGRWDIQPSGSTWLARAIAAAAAHPLGAGGARYRVNGEAGEVETVPFGAYPRGWLEKVGGYDESLLTNEDYELNERLRKVGGVVWFDPRIETVYYARATLGALWRQYARYGYWKAHMLKRYPGSLKWRQALPPLFVLALFVLAGGAFLLPAARWLFALQLGSYLLVLSMAGMRVARRRHDLVLAPGFALAVAVMHLAWGGAFLWSALQQLVGGNLGTT